MNDEGEVRVFSLSMLDAILGGLGAMVIVVLLLSRLLDISEANNAQLVENVGELEAQLAQESEVARQRGVELERLRTELAEVREELDDERGGDRNDHREWRQGRNIILTDTRETSQGWRVRYRCTPDSGWICHGCGGGAVTGGGYSGQ